MTGCNEMDGESRDEERERDRESVCEVLVLGFVGVEEKLRRCLDTVRFLPKAPEAMSNVVFQS